MLITLVVGDGLLLCTWLDVVSHNVGVVSPVRPVELMSEAQGVDDLVDDGGATVVDEDLVVDANHHAHVGRASALFVLKDQLVTIRLRSWAGKVNPFDEVLDE